MKKKKIKKSIFVVLLFFIVLAIIGYTAERLARSNDLSKYAPNGKMISIGTHKLHLDCRGIKNDSIPIIILEAGLDPLGTMTWSKIHHQLSLITRTCAYDRAGVAWSETGPQPRDGYSLATELKNLLDASQENGPYLMVGHSMGGPYNIIFSNRFRNDVVGLVLIESSHPEQFQRMPAELVRKPPPKLVMNAIPYLREIGAMRLVMQDQLNYSDLLDEQEQKVLYSISSTSMSTVLSEYANIELTFEQTAEVESLGDLPLMVLASSDPPDASKINMPGFDQQKANEIHQLWYQMQVELSRLSSLGKVVPVSNASHYLHFDRPQVVIEAVSEMIDAILSNRK